MPRDTGPQFLYAIYYASRRRWYSSEGWEEEVRHARLFPSRGAAERKLAHMQEVPTADLFVWPVELVVIREDEGMQFPPRTAPGGQHEIKTASD